MLTATLIKAGTSYQLPVIDGQWGKLQWSRTDGNLFAISEMNLGVSDMVPLEGDMGAWGLLSTPAYLAAPMDVQIHRDGLLIFRGQVDPSSVSIDDDGVHSDTRASAGVVKLTVLSDDKLKFDDWRNTKFQPVDSSISHQEHGTLQDFFRSGAMKEWTEFADLTTPGRPMLKPVKDGWHMMWRSDYPKSGSLLTLLEMVSRVCTLYCLDGYFLGNIFYVVDPYLTAPVAIALDAVDPQSRKLFCRKPFDLVKTEDYFWTIDRATDSIVETKRWLTSPPEPEGLESYSLEAGIMLGWTQEGYAGKRRRAEELLRGMPGIELTVADVVFPQVLVIRFGERRYHVTQLEIDLEGEETKLTAEQIA